MKARRDIANCRSRILYYRINLLSYQLKKNGHKCRVLSPAKEVGGAIKTVKDEAGNTGDIGQIPFFKKIRESEIFSLKMNLVWQEQVNLA